MHELCDACQSASYCRQSGCIPLTTQNCDKPVDAGIPVDWFYKLGLVLASLLLALVIALSAGWIAPK